MPLPTPEKNESHDDFNERCMDDEVMNNEYPDGEQRFAVCESQWEGKKTKVQLRTITAQPHWLRASPRASTTVGVDRQQNAILGYIVAQAGPFLEPDPRGEFDGKSLKQIVKLINAEKAGLKSRFTHPDLSSDGLGKFLGRSRNARLDTIRVKGEELEVVRADLFLDPTSFDTPHGNLGKYILDLAESDPDAFASSLVLQADEELRMEKGRRALGDNGKELPPLWRPTVLHASDVVDTGAAASSFLSADTLPDAAVRRGAEILDTMFLGIGPHVIRARCEAWLDRYLSRRFGDQYARDLERGQEDLAAPGDLAVGNIVQFMAEYPDTLHACRLLGVIEQVATSRLAIPGTSLELTGTASDPAALVRLLGEMADGMDDPEPEDEWYLVPFSRLTKVVMPSMGDSADYGAPMSGNADEALLLEIDLMAMGINV